MDILKRFLRPRAIAVVIVATVLMLSGILGGIFASTLRMSVHADPVPPVVLGRYEIKKLPRKQIELGNTPTTTPSITPPGVAKLYFITDTGAVNVTTYAQRGTYEWRFFENNTATKPIYTYTVTVYQTTLTIGVPTSARDVVGTDGKIVADKIAYIPNIAVPGKDIIFPLPTSLVDKNGVNLFNDVTPVSKTLANLREDVINTSTWDLLTTALKNARKIAEDTAAFKSLIYSHMTIKFSAGTNKGGVVTDVAKRTFSITTAANRVTATYKLNDSTLKAEYTTPAFNVVATAGRDAEIVYQLPPTGFSDLTSASLNYNEPRTLPTPTLSLRSDEITKPNNGGTFKAYNFGGAVSTIPTYTYITVKHWNTITEDGKTAANPTTIYDNVIIDDSTNYKFTPQHAGAYLLTYHTTTMFGAGYTDNYGKADLDKGGIIRTDATGTAVANGEFIDYTPHSLFFVTYNSTKPKFNWSVPYAYYINTTSDASTLKDNEAKIDDAGYIITKAQPAQVATRKSSIAREKLDAIVDAKQSVAIVLEDNDLFDVKAGQILDRTGVTNNGYFDEAPNLSRYVPTEGLTPNIQTQVNDQQKFVLPAMLGHSNLPDGGRTLHYQIKLARVDANGTRVDINFSNHSDVKAPSTTNTKPTTFYYDPTQPFELDFGNDSADYQNGHYLAVFNDGVSRYGTYQLTVTVTDNQTGIPGLSNYGLDYTKYYSFKLASPEAGSTPLYDANTTAKRPTLTEINVDKTAYYTGDKISFSALNASDAYTLDVEVEYYLTYLDQSSTETNKNVVIKLDRDTQSDKGTITFELSKTNRTAGVTELFTALGKSANGNYLSMRIVAVAKNYFALNNQIDGDLQPIAVKWFDNAAVQNYVANPVPTDLPAGIDVKIQNIEMFTTDYGVNPTIGLKQNKINASDTTYSGAYTDDLPTMQTYWGKFFEDKPEQNKGEYKLPAIGVKYGSGSYQTAIALDLTSENGKPVRINGGSSVLTSVGTAPKYVENRTFEPDQMGTYKFSVTAINNGGNATVLIGEFDVEGTPSSAVKLAANGTARVGQPVTLPSADLNINGKDYEARGGLIYEKEGAQTQLANASYEIIGEHRGGTHGKWFPGLTFAPDAEGRWTFKYEFNVTIAGKSAEIKPAYYYLDVTGLADGDIAIQFDEYGYDHLTDEADIENYNVISDMVAFDTNAIGKDKDVDLTMADLNRGMVQVKEGTSLEDHSTWTADEYTFGRIYIPRMKATGNILNLSGFNMEDASRVTVTHSRDSGTFLFDSKDIGTDSNLVGKDWVRKNVGGNATYYWFEPTGVVKVPKPTAKVTGIEVAGSTVIGDTTAAAIVAAGVEWKVGFAYHYDVNTGTTEAPVIETRDATLYWNPTDGWWAFDYYDENYITNRYGRGNATVNPDIIPDGIYTVTYTVTYLGHSETFTYRVHVGDTAQPEITFTGDLEKDLFGATYEAGKTWFSFSTKDIRVNPNGGTITPQDGRAEYNFGDGYEHWYIAKKLRVTVRGPKGDVTVVTPNLSSTIAADDKNYVHPDPINTDDIRDYWRYIRPTDAMYATAPEIYDEYGFFLYNGARVIKGLTTAPVERTFKFWLADEGEYEVYLSIKSETGADSIPYKVTIKVNAKPVPNGPSPQTIWGTILIILSAGLLIGIVWYFVQSGRKTRFANANGGKKARGFGKAKPEVANTPMITTPETVDAPAPAPESEN